MILKLQIKKVTTDSWDIQIFRGSGDEVEQAKKAEKTYSEMQQKSRVNLVLSWNLSKECFQEGMRNCVK